MSIIRCEYCELNIDTDFNAEHFDSENSKYYCIQEEDDTENPLSIKEVRGFIDNLNNKNDKNNNGL